MAALACLDFDELEIRLDWILRNATAIVGKIKGIFFGCFRKIEAKGKIRGISANRCDLVLQCLYWNLDAIEMLVWRMGMHVCVDNDRRGSSHPTTIYAHMQAGHALTLTSMARHDSNTSTPATLSIHLMKEQLLIFPLKIELKCVREMFSIKRICYYRLGHCVCSCLSLFRCFTMSIGSQRFVNAHS